MTKPMVLGSIILVGSTLLAGCGLSGNVTATPTGKGHHNTGTVHTNNAPSSTSTSAGPSPSKTISSSASSPTSSISGITYTTYHNRIWGYSLNVPKNLTKSAPPEDGDGESWNSGSAQIVVWGQYSDATGHTATVASALNTLDQQKHPSYQAHGSDWLVVSGIEGSKIYYMKEFIGPVKEDVLSISYPTSAKSEWQSIVTTVVNSFNPGPLS